MVLIRGRLRHRDSDFSLPTFLLLQLIFINNFIPLVLTESRIVPSGSQLQNAKVSNRLLNDQDQGLILNSDEIQIKNFHIPQAKSQLNRREVPSQPSEGEEEYEDEEYEYEEGEEPHGEDDSGLPLSPDKQQTEEDEAEEHHAPLPEQNPTENPDERPEPQENERPAEEEYEYNNSYDEEGGDEAKIKIPQENTNSIEIQESGREDLERFTDARPREHEVVEEILEESTAAPAPVPSRENVHTGRESDEAEGSSRSGSSEENARIKEQEIEDSIRERNREAELQRVWAENERMRKEEEEEIRRQEEILRQEEEEREKMAAERETRRREQIQIMREEAEQRRAEEEARRREKIQRMRQEAEERRRAQEQEEEQRRRNQVGDNEDEYSYEDDDLDGEQNGVSSTSEPPPPPPQSSSEKSIEAVENEVNHTNDLIPTSHPMYTEDSRENEIFEDDDEEERNEYEEVDGEIDENTEPTEPTGGNRINEEVHHSIETSLSAENSEPTSPTVHHEVPTIPPYSKPGADTGEDTDDHDQYSESEEKLIEEVVTFEPSRIPYTPNTDTDHEDDNNGHDGEFNLEEDEYLFEHENQRPTFGPPLIPPLPTSDEEIDHHHHQTPDNNRINEENRRENEVLDEIEETEGNDNGNYNGGDGHNIITPENDDEEEEFDPDDSYPTRGGEAEGFPRPHYPELKPSGEGETEAPEPFYPEQPPQPPLSPTEFQPINIDNDQHEHEITESGQVDLERNNFDLEGHDYDSGREHEQDHDNEIIEEPEVNNFGENGGTGSSSRDHVEEDIRAKIECFMGFQLSGDGSECLDIDECSLEFCGPQQICTNLPGSYRCSCPPGFVVDYRNERACRDENECEKRNGGCYQDCINTPGSYYCACSDDFILLGDGHACELKPTTTTTTTTTTTPRPTTIVTTTTTLPPTTTTAPLYNPTQWSYPSQNENHFTSNRGRRPNRPHTTTTTTSTTISPEENQEGTLFNNSNDLALTSCPTPPVPRGAGIAYLYCSRSPIGIYHRHSQLERRLLQNWAARRNRTGGLNNNVTSNSSNNNNESNGIRYGIRFRGRRNPKRKSRQTTYSPGSMCELRCRPGFELEGQYTLQCNGTVGTWHGPTNGYCRSSRDIGISYSETTPSNEIPRLPGETQTHPQQRRPYYRPTIPTTTTISQPEPEIYTTNATEPPRRSPLPPRVTSRPYHRPTIPQTTFNIPPTTLTTSTTPFPTMVPFTRGPYRRPTPPPEDSIELTSPPIKPLPTFPPPLPPGPFAPSTYWPIHLTDSESVEDLEPIIQPQLPPITVKTTPATTTTSTTTTKKPSRVQWYNTSSTTRHPFPHQRQTIPANRIPAHQVTRRPYYTYFTRQTPSPNNPQMTSTTASRNISTFSQIPFVPLQTTTTTTSPRNSFIQLTYRFKTPWIKCPDDMKIDLPPNSALAYVIIPQPQTNVDWWRQVSSEPSWAKGLETELGPGKKRITFRARTSAPQNNTAECSFTLEIRDLEPPKVRECPESFSVRLNGRQNARTVSWIEPTFTDNIKVASVKKSHEPGAILTGGEHLINYEARDSSDNMVKCTFTINVLPQPYSYQNYNRRPVNTEVPNIYNQNQTPKPSEPHSTLKNVVCHVGKKGRRIVFQSKVVPRGCSEMTIDVLGDSSGNTLNALNTVNQNSAENVATSQISSVSFAAHENPQSASAFSQALSNGRRNNRLVHSNSQVSNGGDGGAGTSSRASSWAVSLSSSSRNFDLQPFLQQQQQQQQQQQLYQHQPSVSSHLYDRQVYDDGHQYQQQQQQQQHYQQSRATRVGGIRGLDYTNANVHTNQDGEGGDDPEFRKYFRYFDWDFAADRPRRRHRNHSSKINTTQYASFDNRRRRGARKNVSITQQQQQSFI